MARQEDTGKTAIGWLVAATSFAFVVTQLDVTIVNVALPRIAESLRVNVAGLQWVVDAYALTFAVLMLSAGVLSDRFGAKRSYIIGLGVFALASLGCGAAPGVGFLVAARGMQGVAAALLIPSSLALINHITAHDPALRAWAIGLWTAAGSVAIAAGPVLGGVLLASFGWRSIFLVNVPLCAIGMIITAKSISVSEEDDSGVRTVAHLDAYGQVLGILALTGLTGAVIEFRPLGGGHPLVIGGFVLGLIAGIGFVAVEAKSPKPMLPLEFFGRPNFSPAVLYGVLVNLTFYGMIFVLSLYLQQARGYSVIQTGLAYLPMMSTFILSNVASGRMTAWIGSRVPMILGAAIATVGYALLHVLGPRTPYWDMLPAFILIPSGMGLGVPAMTTTILGSVDRSRAGTASAVLNSARQTGGAIGVAVFGALVGGLGLQIISGLKTIAICSTTLLIVAGLFAWFGIGRPLRTISREEAAEEIEQLTP